MNLCVCADTVCCSLSVTVSQEAIALGLMAADLCDKRTEVLLWQLIVVLGVKDGTRSNKQRLITHISLHSFVFFHTDAR